MHLCRALMFLLILGVVLGAQAPPQGVGEAPHYVQLERLPMDALLPPPPAPGSLMARADLETVLQVQRWRTPEQVAWALSVEKGTVWDNQAVIGPWFRRERLPACSAFLGKVEADARLASARAKARHHRPRPPSADARVRPCVRVDDSTSYPSGHGILLHVWARVLAELLPTQRGALLDFARRRLWGRVIGGAHHPTDLLVTEALADALLEQFRMTPAFQADLERSRAEIRQVQQGG